MRRSPFLITISPISPDPGESDIRKRDHQGSPKEHLRRGAVYRVNGQSLIDKFPHAPKGEGIFLSQGMSRIVQQKEEKAIFLGGSVRRILIMKVVAFNGSARKDGNTAILVRHVFAALEEEGIETELVQLAGKPVHGCTACGGCMKERNRRCTLDDDVVNECIGKMEEADGIILASPTYFADVSPEIKALMDRAGLVAIFNNAMFRRKVGAAVVAVRRGGAIHAFDTLNHFFFISEMVVPGSSYWNVGIGFDRGDVEKDEEGIRTMRVLGENMAWVMKKLCG